MKTEKYSFNLWPVKCTCTARTWKTFPIEKINVYSLVLMGLLEQINYYLRIQLKFEFPETTKMHLVFFLSSFDPLCFMLKWFVCKNISGNFLSNTCIHAKLLQTHFFKFNFQIISVTLADLQIAIASLTRLFFPKRK